MGNLCAKPQTKGETKAGGTTTANGAPPTQTDKLGTHKALQLLGEGTAAVTWLFDDHELSRPVAIKMFTRPITGSPPDAIQREVMVQTELGPGHINLINVYTLFLTPDCLGIVMEWGEGGSMIQWLEKRMQQVKSSNQLVISEDEALFYFRQLISAVSYCHAHGIAHRDLKLDNTLLDGNDPPVMKLCDFGFARHFNGPKEICNSHLGTPEYMSPELLHKTKAGTNAGYDARRSDVWAAGVMLVVWLCGAFAFDTRDHAGSPDAEEDLWKDETTFAWKESPHIKNNIGSLSPEVIDLLDKIFLVQPEERITVEGIKQHPWFQQTLKPKYQKALDKMLGEQRGLEAHVSKTKFDTAKVQARSEAIRNLILKATEGNSKTNKAGLNLQRDTVYDLKGPHIEQVNLAESSIVASGERTDSEAKIVRERFDRVSVSKAVQSAFEGNASQDLHNAAEQARHSRQ